MANPSLKNSGFTTTSILPAPIRSLKIGRMRFSVVIGGRVLFTTSRWNVSLSFKDRQIRSAASLTCDRSTSSLLSFFLSGVPTARNVISEFCRA